jgi:deoxyribodipyrimidine photo-lyase
VPLRLAWLRRDLRLHDNPMLAAAAAGGSDVLPVFVLDPALLKPSGAARRTFLAGALRDLEERIGLLVVEGDPTLVIPELMRDAGADEVHVAADFGPYGARRDARIPGLVRTGSPYAVAPGRVTKDDGTPYKVFTPFHKAWTVHGWRAPAPDADIGWARAPRGWGTRRTTLEATSDAALPEPTEAAARGRWEAFRDERLDTYADDRDRPDLDRTSRLSADLRWGLLHPRTLLADLGGGKGADTFRKELCWREFYADVLHHSPASARTWWNDSWQDMQVDTSAERFTAWATGRTGFPFVDAGMRQLLGEGWVHNRVRMIVASFLVKDLHLDWRLGARHFMRHLVDGDLASNQHGWQWVAGSGTDAAPYFRIFNPVTQGLRFDPEGDYVRRWVPELADIAGRAVHEPWKILHGSDYPDPIVDHAVERDEALARYSALRDS